MMIASITPLSFAGGMKLLDLTEIYPPEEI
jgi:hypothetical protein